MLQVGATVRIVQAKDIEETRYVGMVGTITDIDSHADDGDAFGVTFPVEQTLDTIGHTHAVYFWQEELEIVNP